MFQQTCLQEQLIEVAHGAKHNSEDISATQAIDRMHKVVVAAWSLVKTELWWFGVVQWNEIIHNLVNVNDALLNCKNLTLQTVLTWIFSLALNMNSST